MDVYLSGISGIKDHLLSGELNPRDVYALESFYGMQDWERDYIPRFGKFMLDSGAFTFIYGNKKHSIDWEKYADAYAEFIKAHDIRLFFELDIESIVGMQEVERLRQRIENRACRQSIPVWHVQRGKDYFLHMCEEYDYVAIGGLAQRGAKAMRDEYLTWFIRTAHKYGKRIHGLGYTKTKQLYRYNFDSVDSTTWTNAGRFGELQRFNGHFIERIASVEGGKKVRSLRDYKAASWHNFQEWVKFQKHIANY